MPSLDEVLAFRDERYTSSTALIRKKGADYNRDQQEAGDTLFNLRVCEILGIVPSTEEGILVRLSDKLMRLISLTKPGRDAAMKDESVLDTINDVHNYVDYLGLIWLQRRETARMATQTSDAVPVLPVQSTPGGAEYPGSGPQQRPTAPPAGAQHLAATSDRPYERPTLSRSPGSTRPAEGAQDSEGATRRR